MEFGYSKACSGLVVGSDCLFVYILVLSPDDCDDFSRSSHYNQILRAAGNQKYQMCGDHVNLERIVDVLRTHR